MRVFDSSNVLKKNQISLPDSNKAKKGFYQVIIKQISHFKCVSIHVLCNFVVWSQVNVMFVLFIVHAHILKSVYFFRVTITLNMTVQTTAAVYIKNSKT